MGRVEQGYPIGEVARRSGVTTRTLRHYDEIGLLAPTHTAANGWRQYDQSTLVRLLRILLLRQFGMALPEIADVLACRVAADAALPAHLDRLHQQADRVRRQISSVQHTLAALQKGGDIMPGAMFDGFDNEQHRAEVQQRWGDDAWDDSRRWWEGLGPGGQSGFRAESTALVRDWRRAVDEGLSVTSPQALELVRWQADWIARAWGGRRPSAAELRGLGEMYVADPRFTETYGGEAVARFVRDALAEHAGDVTR